MSYHKLYAQVLQALPQAVCHCDGQGIIRESNPAAQALLGYAPDMLQQTWWLELVHVSDQAHIEDAWHALQEQADVPSCTVRCLRGNSYDDAYAFQGTQHQGMQHQGTQHQGIQHQGTQHQMDLLAYVPVRVTFTATYDDSGTLEHVLLWLELNPATHPADDIHSVVPEVNAENIADATNDVTNKDVANKDITNNKGINMPPLNTFEGYVQVGNVQTLLSEPACETIIGDQQASQHPQHDRVIARDFYLDTRPAITAVLDRQWRVVQVSDAAAAMIGQSTDEVVGCSLWELLPKMRHNQAGQALQQAMHTGEPLYYEFVAEDERLHNAWHGVHVIPIEDHLVVKVEDLTARKATEQRLVAAKHRAEVLFAQRTAILESISDYFFILNRDYRFVYANQAVLELLEETPQSILNRSVWDVVTLPADNPFRQAYQKAVSEQVPQRVRYHSSNPKLTGQTLEIALYPFQGGVIGYSRDVSEFETLRQQLDQALADKEAILNSIRDGVTVLTRDWLYVYANSAVLKRRPDILGKYYFDLFPENRGSVFERKYRQAFDTQMPVFFEAQTAGGEWAEVRVYPAGNSITIYTANISEHKQLEHDLHETNRKLQASEAKFRAFFADSNTAHFILNLQYPDLPIERFTTNQAFDRMFAGTHLASTNRHLTLAAYQSISRQLTDDYYPLLERGLRDEAHVTRADKHYLNRDGSSFWADVSSVFVRDEQGEPTLVISTIVDITAQKQTQQALEASEAKFRNFFERSSVPYTLSIYEGGLEGEGNYLYLYNQAFAELVADTTFLDDLEPTSLASVNQAIDHITHPEDISKQTALEVELAQGKHNGYNLKKRYLRRDGTMIWVSLDAQLWHDADTNQSFVIATVYDISQQVHTEQNLHAALEQLEASERKFRTFFEASTTPLFMYMATEDSAEDDQATWLFNQAFHDFLRHTAWPDYDHDSMTLEQAAEIIQSITHPEDVAHERHYMDEIFAGERDGYRMEKRYLNRDGSILWGDLNTVTVRDEDGNMRLTTAIVQDITQIKRTEQALKTSEARFRAFFENNNTPCTMFIFHDDGEWEQGFHFNDAFADFLKDTTFADYADRLSSVEDTMHALTAIGHPEDNALDEHYVGEVVAGKRDQYYLEKRYFTRDGAVIWGEISSVFLRDEQGELTLGMSIIQDITERKRAQAALEQALADKEILLKEVHHRTKNNMQLISSMLALQSRRIADEIAKEALVDSSKRINLLANMHRVLYQTSDGDLIDLSEQLSSLVKSLTLSFRADITVIQEISPVHLDVHQAIPLGLIANELLTNAFKHAFPEASSEDILTVRLQQIDDVVVLEIQDNGIGLMDDYPQDHLGMIIVESLSHQIDATFALHNVPEGGCLARVSFQLAHK